MVTCTRACHTALERVVNLDDYVEALVLLRSEAGNPPYRALARRVGSLLKPPREVSFRTVADVFQPGRRRLDLDLVMAIVRALGGDSEQPDAWRRAYLRVHADTKNGGPAGVFQQLPADLATFTGREDDLRHLLKAADGTDSAAATIVITAIDGMAGVGKTQLAVHLAHRLVQSGQYGDTQFFVNLRGFDPERPPVDPTTVLGTFLRALNVPADEIPDSLDARAAMYRDRMHGRNAIIVLDNAASERQVRDLIPGHPGSLVLITSRRALTGLDGASRHHLDSFTAAEARQLLARIAGADRVAKEEGAAVELIRLCGYLPLAVALTASYARSRPGWTLADVVDRLAAGNTSTLRAGDRNLHSVFELSYRALDPGLQRVFRLLSLHPGADFSITSAAALCGLSTSEAESALDGLLDENLLQTRAGRRVEFHDLLRAFALERSEAEDDPDTRHAALVNVLDWFMHAASSAALSLATARDTWPAAESDQDLQLPRFNGHHDALAWFALEELTLIAAINMASELNAYRPDCTFTVNLSDSRKQNAQPAKQLTTLRIDPAFAVRSDDDHGWNALHNVLAIAEALHGSLEQAAEHFQAASQLRHESGRPLAKVAALGNLGAVYRQMERLDDAVTALEQGLRIGEHHSIKRGLGPILAELGEVHLDRDDLEQAEIFLLRALDLYREVGDDRGASQSLNSLGTCMSRRGGIEKAIELREEALATARRVGLVDQSAQILDDLAADADSAGLELQATRYRREAAYTRAA